MARPQPPRKTYRYYGANQTNQSTQPNRPVRPASAPPAQARRGRNGCMSKLLVLGIFLGMLAAVFVVLSVVTYGVLAGELADDIARLENVENRESFETNYIYDRNGTLLYEFFGEGRRTRIPLSDMPKDLINATVATEDKTFWDNPGVDMPAILRAVYQNFRGGEIQSGASTITQQFVRQVAFDYDERVERSYTRKGKEIIMAMIFARQHTKEEVLELYLNEIYYGHLAYGIEAAAQTYFGKPAHDLTLAESTLLAGLPQAPEKLDPLEDIKAAKARQRVVLDLMVDNGYITPDEADAAFQAPLKLVEPQVSLLAPHFVTYARQQLEDQFGPRAVARGGLSITTTVDLALNQQIQQIAHDHVAELTVEHNVHNAAVVVLKPGSGEILAMVGSVDYYDESIDGKVNVTIRDRQPGSSIKPITYVTAFENGLTNASIIWDAPTTIGDYKPENYDGHFHGPLLPRMALANSYNIPAVKVLKLIGVQAVLDNAHRMGITGLQNGADYYGLSLTLGGGEVKLLDLTTAYATLANGGNFVAPTPFLKITNSHGDVLYQLQPPQPQPAVDPRAAYLVTNILSDAQARCPAFGCPSALDVSHPAAVKTGTTNDFRDNWTLGFTPYMAVGVWVGNSDNSQMEHSTGITGAAPIWHDVMEAIFVDPRLMPMLEVFGKPPQDGFSAPPGIVQAAVCNPQTTHGGAPCGQVTELFIEGTTAQTPLGQAQAVKLPNGGFCTLKEGQTVPPEALVTVTGLPLPADPEEAKEVRAWAPANGWPISAPPECTDEMLKDLGSLEYSISAPAPGETVTGTVTVIGTVKWGAGQTGTWTVQLLNPDGNGYTVGGPSGDPVENGQLAQFDSAAVGQGDHLLRLQLVLADGSAPPSFDVNIVIGSKEEPTEEPTEEKTEEPSATPEEPTATPEQPSPTPPGPPPSPTLEAPSPTPPGPPPSPTPPGPGPTTGPPTDTPVPAPTDTNRPHPTHPTHVPAPIGTPAGAPVGAPVVAPAMPAGSSGGDGLWSQVWEQMSEMWQALWP